MQKQRKMYLAILFPVFTVFNSKSKWCICFYQFNGRFCRQGKFPFKKINKEYTHIWKKIIIQFSSIPAGNHQTAHLLTGFIGLPAGHLKASAKAWLFFNVTSTLKTRNKKRLRTGHHLSSGEEEEWGVGGVGKFWFCPIRLCNFLMNPNPVGSQ